jgi:hypothetical protein
VKFSQQVKCCTTAASKFAKASDKKEDEEEKRNFHKMSSNMACGVLIYSSLSLSLCQ